MALLLLLLTACGGGGGESIGGGEVVTPPTNPEQGGGDPPYSAGPAMAFSAVFADREGEKPANAPTRGVGDGEFGLDNEALQASGFGVYCWYTGSNNYPEGSDIRSLNNPKPTILMLNQQVIYSGGQWTYSPTKYWPLDASEKLTLRAYAPYVSYQLQTNATTGLPMLPVVVKNDDYQNGTQHDPLWGTSKHGGSDWVSDDDDGTKYGVLYNNYTYAMSGNKTSKDERDGYIDWYFHHGMSKLMFACTVIKDPGCTKVTIQSIKIENLYTQGLLSLGSPTERNTDKPDWDQRDGSMTVDIATEYLAQNPFEITITDSSQPTGPFDLLSKGLLIIPRDFRTGDKLRISVTYTIDSDATPLTAKAEIGSLFAGNTTYTLKMNLTPSTKGLEITMVQSAFTKWGNETEGEHEVYNW